MVDRWEFGKEISTVDWKVVPWAAMMAELKVDKLDASEVEQLVFLMDVSMDGMSAVLKAEVWERS